MELTPVDHLERLSDADCTALRACFAEQGYTSAVIDASERIAPKLFDALRLPLVRWSLAHRPSPGGDLARLFAYGESLARAHVVTLLGEALTERLLAAQVLVHPQGGTDTVVAGFMLMPFAGLWLLADDMSRPGDTVMGPGPTTGEIAQVVPQRVTGSVLDVGCGAGTLALLGALRGATRAVGVDVNHRAIAVARFNARLNGLTAEFRAGDLTAPVRGERFDLVLSQPPFVTQPADVDATTYLHGGARGDELSFRLLTELPGVLSPAGRAVVLFDTPTGGSHPVHARIRAALGASAVDVLVVAAPGHTADNQAIAYASMASQDFGPAYAAVAVQYRRHLDAMGVHEVTHALVVIDGRPGVPGGRTTVTLPVNTLRGIDSEVLDTAHGALALASAHQGALREACVRASSRVRFVEVRTTLDRTVAPVYRLEFGPGALTADMELGEAAMMLLEALDQSATVDAAIGLYAEACDATPDEVRPQALEAVQRWLAQGVLVPA